MAAWPGVLTLLSVLAVVLGAPVQVQASGQRLTVSNVAPVLPEMRPAPQPSSQVPLTPAPPPEPFRLDEDVEAPAAQLPIWDAPNWRLNLALMGRQQTDGG